MLIVHLLITWVQGRKRATLFDLNQVNAIVQDVLVALMHRGLTARLQPLSLLQSLQILLLVEKVWRFRVPVRSSVFRNGIVYSSELVEQDVVDFVLIHFVKVRQLYVLQHLGHFILYVASYAS